MEKFEAIIPTLDVNLGEENILEMIEIGMALEGMSNKIVVLLDEFRSGYECVLCRGKGKVNNTSRCLCDPIPPDPEGNKPGTRDRRGNKCELCDGDYLSKRSDSIITCPKCNGKGGLLEIPDTAKALPTTGVVVSIGPNVTKVKLNHRVICSPYSGTFLPMKGKATVKIYTEDEPLAYLYNMTKETIEKEMIQRGKLIPLATSKFIEYDTPLGETQNM